MHPPLNSPLNSPLNLPLNLPLNSPLRPLISNCRRLPAPSVLIFPALLTLLCLFGGPVACGPASEAGVEESAASGAPAQLEGSSATGELVVEGAWQGRYSLVELGSRVKTDPVRDSMVLRLNLGSGAGDYPRALVDMNRLPASLAAGVYELGPGSDVRGEVILRPKDPAGSGLRFSLASGRLVLGQAEGGLISGSFEAEGEEVTFNKPARRVQVRGEFAGVEVRRR